jgi:hypothetical protein
MNHGLTGKVHCRLAFPKGSGLKSLGSLLTLIYNPFQWVLSISPQFTRGWAGCKAFVQILDLLSLEVLENSQNSHSLPALLCGRSPHPNL